MASALSVRTRVFAVQIIHLYVALPKNELTRILGRQFLRSGTSVGAHCREAFRSRSNAELISKLEVALQELDETLYWMELLLEADVIRRRTLEPLMAEIEELIKIVVASVLTIKRRRR